MTVNYSKEFIMADGDLVTPTNQASSNVEQSEPVRPVMQAGEVVTEGVRPQMREGFVKTSGDKSK